MLRFHSNRYAFIRNKFLLRQRFRMGVGMNSFEQDMRLLYQAYWDREPTRDQLDVLNKLRYEQLLSLDEVRAVVIDSSVMADVADTPVGLAKAQLTQWYETYNDGTPGLELVAGWSQMLTAGLSVSQVEGLTLTAFAAWGDATPARMNSITNPGLVLPLRNDATVVALSDWYTQKYKAVPDALLVDYWQQQVFVGKSLGTIESNTAYGYQKLGAKAGELLNPVANGGEIRGDVGFIFSRDAAGKDIVDGALTKVWDAQHATDGQPLYVRLAGQPTADVALVLDTADPDKGLLAVGPGGAPAARITLSFTPDTWAVPQLFTALRGPAVSVVGSATNGFFAESFSDDPAYSHLMLGNNDPFLVSTVVTDHKAGATVASDFSILTDETTGHLSVVLNTRPSADVTVVVRGLGDEYAVNGTAPNGPEVLVFKPDAWNKPQSLTLTRYDFQPGQVSTDNRVVLEFVSDDPDYAAAPAQSVAIRVAEETDNHVSVEINNALHDQFLIYNVYDAVLGRAPDPLGDGYWVAQYEQGASLREIATSFLQSAEAIRLHGSTPDSQQLVDRLYQNLLDRSATSAELSRWAADIAANKATLADVVVTLARSNEAAVEFLQETMPVAPLVDNLYHAVLGRAPDASGSTYWATQYEQGLSLRKIATSFLQSEEATRLYGATPDSQALVDQLYQNLLDRSATSAELVRWTADLAAHKATLADVVVALVRSDEAMASYVDRTGSVVDGPMPPSVLAVGDSLGLVGLGDMWNLPQVGLSLLRSELQAELDASKPLSAGGPSLDILGDSLLATANFLSGELGALDLPLIGKLGSRAADLIKSIDQGIAATLGGTLPALQGDNTPTLLAANAPTSNFNFDAKTGAFSLSLDGVMPLGKLDVSSDLGLPKVIRFESTGQVAASLTYGLSLAGTAADGTLTFDKSKTFLNAGLKVDGENLSLGGHLGPLSIVARDQASPTTQVASATGKDTYADLNLKFSLDAPGIDPVFNYSGETAPGWLSGTPSLTATGNGQISLGVSTASNFGDGVVANTVEALLPRYKFDLTLPLSVNAALGLDSNKNLNLGVATASKLLLDNIGVQPADFVVGALKPVIGLMTWVTDPAYKVMDAILNKTIDVSAVYAQPDGFWQNFGANLSAVTNAKAVIDGTLRSVFSQLDYNGDGKLQLFDIPRAAVQIFSDLATASPLKAKAMLEYRLGDVIDATIDYGDAIGRPFQQAKDFYKNVWAGATSPYTQVELTKSPGWSDGLVDKLIAEFHLPGVQAMAPAMAAFDSAYVGSWQSLYGEYAKAYTGNSSPYIKSPTFFQIYRGWLGDAADKVVSKIQSDQSLVDVVNTAKKVIDTIDVIYGTLKTLHGLSQNLQAVEDNQFTLSLGNASVDLLGGKPGDFSFNPSIPESYKPTPDAPTTFPATFNNGVLRFTDNNPVVVADPAPASNLSKVDTGISAVDAVFDTLGDLGVDIPVLTNPGLLGNLIVGNPVDLVTFDPQIPTLAGRLTLPLDFLDIITGKLGLVLPKEVTDFVGLSLKGAVSLGVAIQDNLKLGVDTYGLQKWVDSGFSKDSALPALADSFYVAQGTMPDGRAAPAVSLSLDPFVGIYGGLVNKPTGNLISSLQLDPIVKFLADGVKLNVGFAAGAVDASALAGINLDTTTNLYLNDPGLANGVDGKLRLSEVQANIANGLKLFDVVSHGALDLGLKLDASVNPGQIKVTSSWPFVADVITGVIKALVPTLGIKVDANYHTDLW